MAFRPVIVTPPVDRVTVLTPSRPADGTYLPRNVGRVNRRHSARRSPCGMGVTRRSALGRQGGPVRVVMQTKADVYADQHMVYGVSTVVTLSAVSTASPLAMSVDFTVVELSKPAFWPRSVRVPSSVTV